MSLFDYSGQCETWISPVYFYYLIYGRVEGSIMILNVVILCDMNADEISALILYDRRVISGVIKIV